MLTSVWCLFNWSVTKTSSWRIPSVTPFINCEFLIAPLLRIWRFHKKKFSRIMINNSHRINKNPDYSLRMTGLSFLSDASTTYVTRFISLISYVKSTRLILRAFYLNRYLFIILSLWFFRNSWKVQIRIWKIHLIQNSRDYFLSRHRVHWIDRFM